MLKDEYSMTKTRLQALNKLQGKVINIIFKKRASRNSPKNKTKIKPVKSISKAFFGRTYRSLPKINEELKIKNENSTSIHNYFEKKKHLSFYKGTNINVSSIILDTNKTMYTNNTNNNNSFRCLKIKKNYSLNNINEKNSENIKNKIEEKKETINPTIDLSKLNYKSDITSIRNKFSILFNKEFDLFGKFIQSLFTLKLEISKKLVLSQLHDNCLSCIKYLSGMFLDQEIEHMKITESNLTSILTNLLNLFSYTNKINQYIINQTKNLIINANKEKQSKKEVSVISSNEEIKLLKNKIKTKNDTIKKIKKEQFKINNDYMVNMYKLRDEKKDLVKLLLINKNYFEKFQDSQKEIKEKNDIISQKNLDYKMMTKKNFFQKVELEEINNELQKMIKPMEKENQKMKEKIAVLEGEKFVFDKKMANKNEIINQLKENLAMKNEELIKYIHELNKIKYQNDKLSYNYYALKSRYNCLTEGENKMINGDYDGEF